VRGGIRQRIDDLQLLDDRAGPTMRDDERQGVLMFRADMDEVNVEPIDARDEIRQRVELRLDLAPVRTPPPNTARALESLRVARLAIGPRPFRGRASGSRLSAGAIRLVPNPENSPGTDE
jgi:hypothetical protein